MRTKAQKIATNRNFRIRLLRGIYHQSAKVFNPHHAEIVRNCVEEALLLLGAESEVEREQKRKAGWMGK